MKRFTLSVVAIVALLATSCVQADVEDTTLVGGESVVTLAVETTGAADSRTIADGEKADLLHYGVYDANWNLVFAETAPIVDKAARLELKLLTGYTYNFAFWADKGEGAPYTFDFENKTVTVAYGTAANDESRDAFYGVLPAVEVKGSVNKSVSLKRPFAQINFGASDLALAKKSGFNTDDYTTSLTVSAYKTLNLETGAVVGSPEEVTFTAAAPQSETTTLSTSKGDYAWVSMNYILYSNSDPALGMSTCTMVAEDNNGKSVTVSYPNAPARRNWRTNLVGALFTDSTNLDVSIEPDPEGGENNATGYFIKDGVYHIQSAQGLNWFASQVNAGELLNAKVVLENDIDLTASRAAGDNWTPISSATTNYHKTFHGTFDGAGYTISGMVVTHEEAAGLFGYVYDAQISNVTVDGATINSNHYAGGIVAWINNVTGNTSRPAIVENCSVKNSTITSTVVNNDNGDKVGGLVGYAAFIANDYETPNEGAGIFGCLVENTTVKAYRDLAGLIGYATGVTIKKNTVKNVEVIQDLTVDYKATTPTTVGVFVGRNDGGNTLEENTSSEVSVEGGIKIGDMSYVSLAEAVADAEDGATITLAANFAVAEPVVVAEGKSVTLNLNGKTLAANHNKSVGAVVKNNGTLTIVGGVISSLGANGGSAVMNNGTLTVQNATLNGAPNEGEGWPSYTVNNVGTMTVENSTITSVHGAVCSYGEGAVFTLNNTNIEMSGIPGFTSHGIYTYNNGKAVVNGGNIANNAADQNTTGASVINGSVEVLAGNFTGRIENYYGTPVLKGGTYSVQPNAAFVASGYAAKESDGKWIVVKADTEVVNTSEALKNALANSTEVYVTAGEYTFPASSVQAGATITCEEGTVFEGTSSLNINGATVIGAEFKNENGVAVSGTINGTLKNCIFEGSEALRWCYTEAGKTVVFENCVIKTDFRGFHFDDMKGDVIFRNCEINGFNAFGGAGTITFEGCTFGYDNSNYNGLNTYNNVVIKDCEFVFKSGKTNFIDMEGTGKTLTIENCTATLDGVAADVATFVGGSQLANNYVVIDGKITVANAAGMKYAVSKKYPHIVVTGEIDLKDVVLSGHNGIIEGKGDNAVLNTRNFTPGNDEAYQLRSLNLSFKNIDIKLPTSIDWIKSGFVGTGTIVFDHCDFEGQATLNGSATWIFNDCNFVSTESGKYASFVYGATKATFNRCNFSGVERAAKVYGTGGVLDVEYNTCKYTSSTLNKSGVEIDASYATTTVNLNNCSQTAMAGLYALEGAKGVVYVDGVQQ